MSLYQKELKNKAEIFSKELKKCGVKISFDAKSFRDYLLILEAEFKNSKKENLKLYFKPSKNSFSLFHSISDKDFAQSVDKTWDFINGFQSYSADSGVYEAFCDGSFIDGAVGYGAVIYLGADIQTEISGGLDITDFRQFSGEIRAVIEILKWCKKKDVKKIRINYDYIGIEKFAIGLWKPQNEISKEYVNFIASCGGIQIEWRHIKSHSGNNKNNKADLLAKKAAISKNLAEKQCG